MPERFPAEAAPFSEVVRSISGEVRRLLKETVEDLVRRQRWLFFGARRGVGFASADTVG